jgi:hypothetical protein
MDKPPNLWREIGSVAWLMGRLMACVLLIFASISWAFNRNPTLGLIVMYSMLFVGLIGWLGWRNYKWKSHGWDREQKEKLGPKPTSSNQEPIAKKDQR